MAIDLRFLMAVIKISNELEAVLASMSEGLIAVDLEEKIVNVSSTTP